MIGRLSGHADRWAALRAWAVKEIDADVIVLAIGVSLLTIALWTDLHWRALALPGAVLLWLALPPRKPFVVHEPPAEPPVRRKS